MARYTIVMEVELPNGLDRDVINRWVARELEGVADQDDLPRVEMGDAIEYFDSWRADEMSAQD